MDPPEEACKADVYSAALVIWAMRCRQHPHPHLDDLAAAAAAADVTKQLRPSCQLLRWPAVADVLEAAWGTEPASRPTAGILLERLEQLQLSLARSCMPVTGQAATAACALS